MLKFDTIAITIIILSFPFLLGAGIDPAAENHVLKAEKRLPITIGVVMFSDSRPDEEVSSKIRKETCKFGTPSYFTSDGYSTEKTLTRSLSYQIYKDLQIADIFKNVEFLKECSTEEIIKNGIPNRLINNVDAILVGNIKHFYGYSEAPQPNGSGYPGLMGYMLVEAMKERVEYSYEGYSQLTDVKLIDTSNLRVLWEGNVDQNIKSESAVDKNPLTKTQVASRSFHGAINKLVKELDKLEIRK
jgi:hypothetical protein